MQDVIDRPLFKDKGMENSKHLLLIDVLLTMSCGNAVREYPTIEHSTNSLTPLASIAASWLMCNRRMIETEDHEHRKYIHQLMSFFVADGMRVRRNGCLLFRHRSVTSHRSKDVPGEWPDSNVIGNRGLLQVLQRWPSAWWEDSGLHEVRIVSY